MHLSFQFQTNEDWCVVNTSNHKQDIPRPLPTYSMSQMMGDLTWNALTIYAPRVITESASPSATSPWLIMASHLYQTRNLWTPLVKYAWYQIPSNKTNLD